jgi:hypothetical protein
MRGAGCVPLDEQLEQLEASFPEAVASHTTAESFEPPPRTRVSWRLAPPLRVRASRRPKLESDEPRDAFDSHGGGGSACSSAPPSAARLRVGSRS